MDPKVEVSESEITAESAGETYDITVTSNVAWTASVADKATWVTVKPASGEAGETPVKVTVKKNNSDAQRETEITFAGETVTTTVAVKQFGKDVVTLDKTSYEATPAGGTDAVQVTANTDWTATVSEGADWVTVAPATGAAGETATTVTVAANPTAEARTAKVTYTAGDAKAEYAITQEALSVTLSQASITDAGEGKTATVNVTANAAWTATSSAEWVTVAPAAGETGVAEVTVTVAENQSEEARNATVTFAINETVSAELTVTQAFVEQAGKVAIAVADITASKATVTCTPDPLTGFTYYFDYLPKEEADILLPSDEDKIAYVVSNVNEVLANYPDYTWADFVSEGVDSYTFTDLAPLTSYYAIAFGVDGNGNVTTKLYKEEFTTVDLNPALKEWVGTWNLTSSDTYGPSGLTGQSSERTITISTSSVFEVELDENDLVVAGLSYTDYYPMYSYTSTGETIPMETVGTVNATGELELKNACEIIEYGEYGMATWYGHSVIDSKLYYISGDYAPYTLAFGSNKNTATGTPATLQLSGMDGEYVIAYYDVKLVADDGVRSFNINEAYGALSGNWTLTKVQETPAAAPKSMKKIETRIAKEMKIKENNLVKNLNSSYLFQSALVR